MDKRASIIEGIGLLLLLFSFGWQCWEESDKEDLQEYELRVLHEKIDHLWNSEYHKYIYSSEYNDNPIRDGKVYLSSMNYISINQSWQHFDKMKELENSFPKDIRINSIIRVLLYVIGSMLILFPKLFPDSKLLISKREAL